MYTNDPDTVDQMLRESRPVGAGLPSFRPPENPIRPIGSTNTVGRMQSEMELLQLQVDQLRDQLASLTAKVGRLGREAGPPTVG